MDLILEKRPCHQFIRWYEDILIKSGLFNITRQELPENTIKNEHLKLLFRDKYRVKYGDLCFIRINDRIVALEAFMRPIHNHRLYVSGLFNDVKPDFWISYYHDPEFEDMIKCPVKPWVTFPSGWKFVQRFKWSGGRHTGIITSGKHSAVLMRRTNWIAKAKELGDFFATDHAIEENKYLDALANSRWGIILSYRRLKNTREYEFPSCGMPIAMNYQPVYEYPFYPGDHYFLMESPDDLEKLRDLNAHHYARQSRWIWDNYLRPDRAVSLLLRILG